MANLYSGQLTVEVPNLVNIPDDENESVYQAFRSRLEAFAVEMDVIVREEYRRRGWASGKIVVDYE